MMLIKLSPKAARFVDTAMRDMDPRSRAIWESVDPKRDLPPEAVKVVLSALDHFERFLRGRLESPRLSEDEAADLSNDLGFICAIVRELSKALGEVRPT
jgi:hypothetical protein